MSLLEGIIDIDFSQIIHPPSHFQFSSSSVDESDLMLDVKEIFEKELLQCWEEGRFHQESVVLVVKDWGMKEEELRGNGSCFFFFFEPSLTRVAPGQW